MLMLVFRSIYQLEPYFYPEVKKYIFRDDIKLDFNFSVPNINILSAGSIFAKNIDAKSITSENLYAENLICEKIISNRIKCSMAYITELIKANEITAQHIHALKIDANILIAADILAKYIVAKKIIYDTVCIAIEHIHCDSAKSKRGNHMCTCLEKRWLSDYYETIYS